MAEIIKKYCQDVPAARFVGKCYGDADRVDGTYGARWCEFFANGWFGTLESIAADFFEDSGAYIGLMRYKDGEPFQYWIGMFMPPETVPPEGFSSVDFDASRLGVCWLQGVESDVYGKEDMCLEAVQADGHKLAVLPDGSNWFMERYACPRFTQPDGEGRVVLDICFYIE